MVGQAHLESGYAEPGNPFAQTILPVPFGVPVRQDEHRSTFRCLYGRTPVPGGRPKVGVDRVVFRPGGGDGAGEGEDVFTIEAVVGGGSGGVPVFAVCDGILGVLTDEFGGIGIVRAAADVFEAPLEGLDAAAALTIPIPPNSSVN